MVWGFFLFQNVLQLNELLFRSLLLFIQNIVLLIQLKSSMISPAGEIHGIPKINMKSGLVSTTGFPIGCIPGSYLEQVL